MFQSHQEFVYDITSGVKKSRVQFNISINLRVQFQESTLSFIIETVEAEFDCFQTVVETLVHSSTNR